MEKQSIKGISRIDSKNTHGWFVRVYYARQTHSKFFSDRFNGGYDDALEAAKKYKEEYEERHPESTKKQPFRNYPQINNKTGVNGVSETFSKTRKGIKIPYFSVSWCPEPGHMCTRKFSINKYGRDEAFAMAVSFRKEKEAEIMKRRGLQSKK
ncbi:hypothetical protein QUF58_11850 [Anaerolineales bacterium HSG24]|nr:hypothetical protein [Anaerolineales bacterium HSG24]